MRCGLNELGYHVTKTGKVRYEKSEKGYWTWKSLFRIAKILEISWKESPPMSEARLRMCPFPNVPRADREVLAKDFLIQLRAATSSLGSLELWVLKWVVDRLQTAE